MTVNWDRGNSNPSPGQIVRVRQRTYLVEEVDPPVHGSDATLVRLACVDDDAQGQPLQVLWDHELDREILGGEAWESIATRGFDPPKLFAAYLDASLRSRFGIWQPGFLRQKRH